MATLMDPGTDAQDTVMVNNRLNIWEGNHSSVTQPHILKSTGHIDLG